MNDPSTPPFVQALDALRAGDRRRAAKLIEQQIRHGNTSARNLDSVAQLAEHIGEIELAIEARRLAILPGSLDSLIAYWAALGTYGRADEALADLERQPAAVQAHPSVLHVRGTIATQFGRFEEAQELFRRALAKAPAAMQTWFALAMVKSFGPGDPDVASMERLEQQSGAPPEAKASLYYALGKAAEDRGDIDQAFDCYSKGAALRHSIRPFDAQRYRQSVDGIISDFSFENLSRLRPSGFSGQRSVFVTGLPRSGTTLTEQILLNHTAVADGSELNLVDAALTPTLGPRLDGALAFEQRSKDADPWGEVGRDYHRLLHQRFPSTGLVVDKSLGQSPLVGLMLHSMPEARIAWLQRDPEDVALSCFRTFFSTGQSWSWSLTDIADYMKVEDRLLEHWHAIFAERILVVPYEELVSTPDVWSTRLQQHFGLPVEAGIERIPREGRPIRTASVGQVREPISTSRIGQAAAFERHLEPFRKRYYR